jgi:FixJ family two-component response regulator
MPDLTRSCKDCASQKLHAALGQVRSSSTREWPPSVRKAYNPPMAALVLLVDDDPEVVHTLREVLESAGYRTLAATSFEDGKRLLADVPPPAVLITDVRLGMFNGLQLAVLRPPTTGVIVISGFLDRTLEAETKRLGGVYMLKPVPRKLLLETVEMMLVHG